jgi:hypothetical protein
LEIKIIIDEDGNVLFNRDTMSISDILAASSDKENVDKVKKFVDEKPPNISGDKEYHSYCG